MRFLFLCLLFLVSSAGGAFAQVAAASLLPGGAGVSDPFFFRTPTFVPVNPAVMSWKQQTAAGFGVARASWTQEKVRHDGGFTEPAFTIDFEDTYAGGVWNGKQYTFGLQVLRMTGIFPGATLEDQREDLAVSSRLGDWLSFGAGYYSDRHTQNFQDGASAHFDLSGLKLGASGRFGGMWYAGLAAIRETVETRYEGFDNINWQGARTAPVFGLGLQIDGPWRFHAEYWTSQFGKVGKETLETIVSDTTRSLVLEAATGPWVAGLTVSERVETRENVFGDTYVYIAKGNEFTVGVVPEKGMSLLFHYGFADSINELPDMDSVQLTGLSRAISAIWIF